MRTHLSPSPHIFPSLALVFRPRRTRTLLFSSRDDNGVFSRELLPALDSSLVFFAASPSDQGRPSNHRFPLRVRIPLASYFFQLSPFLRKSRLYAPFPFRPFPRHSSMIQNYTFSENYDYSTENCNTFHLYKLYIRAAHLLLIGKFLASTVDFSLTAKFFNFPSFHTLLLSLSEIL